jgi:hypothetical protein
VENCTYVYEGRGDDDTSTELLDDRKDGVKNRRPRHKLVDEDGSEDTHRTGNEDGEQQANTEVDIVFAIDRVTNNFLRGATTNAVAFTVSTASVADKVP